MGFAQVGAESGWRTANTKSIQETAEAAGIDLKFTDAQGKQENQIQAIRSYIQQKVDVIAFSPVVETGWDAVLQEAKAADIPVILTDRAVDSEDTSLYKTFLGSDFVVEGEKAGQWLVDNAADSDVNGDGNINVVQLEGTTGAAPAIDRAEGFADTIAADPTIEVTASQTGDFTRDGGKQVMESFLQSDDSIDVVFAHNDDMGLGAIEAIEAAGLDARQGHQDHHRRRRQGRDDRPRRGQDQLHRRVQPAARAAADGPGREGPRRRGGPEPRILTEETTFTQEQAIEALPDRQY